MAQDMQLQYVVDADYSSLGSLNTAMERTSSIAKKSFNEADKALDDYLKTLSASNYKILENGKVVNTMGQEVKKSTAALAELKRQQMAYTPTVTQTAVAVNNATKSMGKNRAAMGQLGYQIQDIANMVSFGASPFIILSTQGSQIASIFGPGGAVVGALLGVAGVIGGVLFNSINSTNAKVDEFKKSLKEMNDVDLSNLEGMAREVAVIENLNERNRLIHENTKLLREQNKIATPKKIVVYGTNEVVQVNAATDAIVDNSFAIELNNEALKENQRQHDILTGKIKVLSDEQKSNQKAVASLVESLKDENAIFGLSAKGQALYAAEKLGATEATLKEIAALSDSLAAKERQADLDEKAAESEKAKAEAIKKVVDQLTMKNAVLGKTNAEVIAYTLAQEGATQAQIDEALAIQKSIDAKEAKIAADKEALKAQDALNKKTQEQAQKADPLVAEQQRYSQQLAALEAYKQQEYAIESNYLALLEAAQYQHEQNKLAIQEQTFRSMNAQNELIMQSFDSLENAATNVFSGMLSGTMSATEAMQSFSNAILNEAIGALVKMGIEQVKQAVIGETLQASAAATAATSAAAVSAAWQPAALAASIATQGAAATVGTTAYTTAMATSAIPFGGGRRSGGTTQAGKVYEFGEGGVEMWQSGGKNYMLADRSGNVLNNKEVAGGMGSSIQFVQNFSVEANATYDPKAMNDLMSATKAQTIQIMQDQMRNGGMFSGAK